MKYLIAIALIGTVASCGQDDQDDQAITETGFWKPLAGDDTYGVDDHPYCSDNVGSSYTYDALGRPLSMTSDDQLTYVWSYDDEELIVTRNYKYEGNGEKRGETVVQNYEMIDGRVDSVYRSYSAGGAPAIYTGQYQYDADSRLTGIQWTGDWAGQRTLQYDPTSGLVASVDETLSTDYLGTMFTWGTERTYEWDSDERLESVVAILFRDDAQPDTTRYGLIYDEQNRLIEEQVDNGNDGNVEFSWLYSYDCE